MFVVFLSLPNECPVLFLLMHIILIINIIQFLPLFWLRHNCFLVEMSPLNIRFKNLIPKIYHDRTK